ncbi:hypothetical protein ACWTU6_11495 [Mesorhizobium sp. BHbsci]
MRVIASVALIACGLVSNSAAFAAGPDVIVGFIDGASQHGAPAAGNVAFSAGTTSCNIGDAELSWRRLPDSRHPVITLNLYRLHDGQMRQLAASWVKHGFFATNEDHCRDVKGVPACVPSASDALGPGCSDPYNASLNANPNWLGPRSKINPTSGAFDAATAQDLSGYPDSAAEDRTLLVSESDLSLTDARFFLEAHYVTADDAASGNSRNNVSFREVEPVLSNGMYTLRFLSTETRGEPALMAWKDATFDELRDEEQGLESFVIIASKASKIAGGRYRYDYSVYNMNSQRGIGRFKIDQVREATDISFSAAPPRGEVWSRDDWASRLEDGQLEWYTHDHADMPRANALRWGTTYSFSFTSASPPTSGAATIHKFELTEGTPSELRTTVVAPASQ